jgi:hypothetical protein
LELEAHRGRRAAKIEIERLTEQPTRDVVTPLALDLLRATQERLRERAHDEGVVLHERAIGLERPSKGHERLRVPRFSRVRHRDGDPRPRPLGTKRARALEP